MNSADIAFPNLGIYLENVPKTFQIGGFQVAMYGIIIAIGMLCGVLLAVYIAGKYKYDQNIIWDFALYGILFGVIGARIYYVIFSWHLYQDDWLSVFNIRRGGLAIYGGVIAAFLTLFIYSYRKKVPYFAVADICVPGLALGQAIGRWGNFFNREVFGQYTESLLAMQLPASAVRGGDISPSIAEHMTDGIDYILVHPTFLYESLWNVALVLLMLYVWKRRRFDGQIALLYLGGYGVGRFWIEGIRTDQLKIWGNLAVSQLFSGFLVVLSVAATVYLLSRNKKAEAVSEGAAGEVAEKASEEV